MRCQITPRPVSPPCLRHGPVRVTPFLFCSVMTWGGLDNRPVKTTILSFEEPERREKGASLPNWRMGVKWTVWGNDHDTNQGSTCSHSVYLRAAGCLGTMWSVHAKLNTLLEKVQFDSRKLSSKVLYPQKGLPEEAMSGTVSTHRAASLPSRSSSHKRPTQIWGPCGPLDTFSLPFLLRIALPQVLLLILCSESHLIAVKRS